MSNTKKRIKETRKNRIEEMLKTDVFLTTKQIHKNTQFSMVDIREILKLLLWEKKVRRIPNLKDTRSYIYVYIGNSLKEQKI